MNKCPFCKHGILEEKTIRQIYTYKGYSTEIEQPGKWCDTCGEGILSGDHLMALEKQIRDFQTKVGGFPMKSAFSDKNKTRQ